MTQSSSVPRPALAQDKKLEIVKWAFDRFYEGGFHATGIDAVMADSGISKRTLYKYFGSKEELIEAVLDYYADGIARALFDPVEALGVGPGEQILAFFDIREAMIEASPRRGCLGIKASQEYAGRHDGIVAHGKRAVADVEQRFIDLCERAGVAQPTQLGKQINILFQGALLLSHVRGDGAPFASARAAAEALLDTETARFAASTRQ